MKRTSICPGSFLAPAFFLAISATVFWQTNTDLVEKDIASGSMQYNAAFVPEVLATVLVVLSVLQIIFIVRAADEISTSIDAADEEANNRLVELGPVEQGLNEHSSIEWGVTFRSVLALFLIALYILAMRPLGYHIATPLLLASMFALLNVRNLILLLGLSFVISVASAYIFGGLLNVVLPAGIFEIAPF